jgi:hypothetical protein
MRSGDEVSDGGLAPSSLQARSKLAPSSLQTRSKLALSELLRMVEGARTGASPRLYRTFIRFAPLTQQTRPSPSPPLGPPPRGLATSRSKATVRSPSVTRRMRLRPPLRPAPRATPTLGCEKSDLELRSWCACTRVRGSRSANLYARIGRRAVIDSARGCCSRTARSRSRPRTRGPSATARRRIE